ncbi:MAG: hypothetical protein ABI914_07165, partial [Acidobacteriota bacterium]
MVKKTILFCAVSLVSALPAFAQEAGTTVATAPSGVRWGVIGAAFLLAIAAAAGATAQGRAT